MYVYIGTLVGSYHLKGLVKLFSDSDRISSYKNFFYKNGESFVEIKINILYKKGVNLYISDIGFNHINDLISSGIINNDIYTLREDLGEELILADIYSLPVITRDNLSIIGEVSGIDNFGAGNLLCIRFNKEFKWLNIELANPTVSRINDKECVLVNEAIYNSY